MGRTYVNGTIFGPSTTKEYRFFVDTGSVLMGTLPIEEIETLGLETVIDGKRTFLTAAGRVQMDTYHIRGQIRGKGFGAMVAPAPIPLVGYEMLQNMEMKVNHRSQSKLKMLPKTTLGHRIC